LGIPMSPSRLSNRDWRVVEERFQKKSLVVGRVSYYHREGGLSLLTRSCVTNVYDVLFQNT
jgi:hypothetical protein